ncbi:MAG: BatD family protein [Rhodanobacteraceae bacterium]
MRIAVLLHMLLLVAPLASAATAGARAWLDRNSMHLGETVTLNVQADGNVDSPPDFSVLSSDFKLLGTQSSQQMSIVNGARSSKTLWAIGLEPTHVGSITIPVLKVGNASTSPLTLTVLAQPAGAKGQPGDDVFLDVSAEPLAPYVQQQVRYTVKLYYAFDLTDGSLDEPAAKGLDVQRLGQDKHYLATVGQQRYHVIERHYALKPERSGTVTIAGLAFHGTALDASDPTGFFNRGRRVNARSDAIELNVRPQPASWGAEQWLPAASMTVQDQSSLPDQAHVGDPVTRTIRVEAKGLGFEQLPAITLAPADGAEVYPDKPQTRTRDDGTWLYGERIRKFAFVPTRPGKLVVPGYSMHWWDTVHDEAQTTAVPPRTIDVLPANGASVAAAPPPSSVAPAPEGAAPVPAPNSPIASSATPSAEGFWTTRRWQVLALASFVLWLATMAMWWRTRCARTGPDIKRAPTSVSSARPQFLRACSLGDLAGAERALVAWAHDEHADVRNLGALATRLTDAKQGQAIADLERARYAGGATEGLASRLGQAFKDGFAWARRGAGDAHSPLPELYPQDKRGR